MTDMADSLPGTPSSESRQPDYVDDVLVERFARGDRAAFGEIVAMYGRRVGQLAYRLTGWRDDVDDVVQDVFLSALKHLPRFRRDSSLWTWLATITVNTCRSRRRRRWLQQRFLRLARLNRRADSAAPPEQGSTDRETFERVRRAVRALPANQREAVVLRYLQGMAIEQVARVLGVRRNAVEVRLHRARARLKEVLRDLVEE